MTQPICVVLCDRACSVTDLCSGASCVARGLYQRESSGPSTGSVGQPRGVLASVSVDPHFSFVRGAARPPGRARGRAGRGRNLRPRREYLDSVARSEFRAHGRSLLLSLSEKRTLGMHSTTLDHWGAKVPPSDFLITHTALHGMPLPMRDAEAARASLRFAAGFIQNSRNV